MPNIADDPSEWTTPIRENNVPRENDEYAPDTKPGILAIHNHTRADYLKVREALWSVAQNSNSSNIRNYINRILRDTPSEGAHY